MPITETYNIFLALLSVTIAIVASFTAFGVAERSASSTQKSQKIAWNLFGAFCMGLGVWSMHFIGMLALELPLQITYDVETTVLSIIPAIGACSIILWMMTQKSFSRNRLLLSGALFAAGVGLMHHTGMMAMKMDAVMIHNKTLSILSLLFAITTAILALKIQSEVASLYQSQLINKKKFLSALVMGLAISGMHYTAMLAVNFIPGKNIHSTQGMSSSGLAVMVTIAIFIIITASLLIPLLFRYKQISKELSHLVKKEKASSARVQSIINAVQLGYWDWDYKTGEHIINAQWLPMLGLSQENAKRHIIDWGNLIHPDDKPHVIETVEAHIQSGTQYMSEFRMKHNDGHWVWIQSSGAVVEYDHARNPIRLCGTYQDISNRKKGEEALQLSARVFSNTHEGIAITDAAGLIIDINPAFSNITGYSREEAIGQNPRILKSGKHEPAPYPGLRHSLKEQGRWQGEVWNYKKNGELYAERLTISTLNNAKGEALNYLDIFSDITDSKKQQKELELMAHYDGLTKLPNRALFYDRFLQAVAHSKRTETLLAVCFLDLDDFKPVNDNYGHNVGDQLLIEVAKRIKASIRAEDTVSRQGGDEFTLLLGDLSTFHPCEKMLKRMLNTLAEPYKIKGEIIEISASLGVTLYPQDNGDIDTLIRHADQAMYQAKLAGKNRYHLFNAEHDQQISLKHQQLGEIQQALFKNQFHLYYQPKVNMKTGKVYGAEALIRWQHPEKGLIPPLDFLPIIEETLLEIQIGEWVIQQALRQLSDWHEMGISIEVSVNIASFHLQSSSFVSQLESFLLKQPTVNPNCLQLEILESSALGDTNIINGIIRSCQETLGVKVALDDFGTGYSSLTHLRNLPADTIKIDQSFVRDMLDDPSDFSIIDGIIGLADSFNRQVIAEGVETTDHGLMLLLMGCQHAQGYGISKPMPATELPEWINSYTPEQSWISCGNLDLSHKEKRIQLFSLAAKQWQKQFEATINAAPGQPQNWPIMDPAQCPCGSWIRREKSVPFFDAAYLDELDKTHNKIHSAAQSLKTLYQEDEIDAAKDRLSEIRTLFTKLNNPLNKLLLQDLG